MNFYKPEWGGLETFLQVGGLYHLETSHLTRNMRVYKQISLVEVDSIALVQAFVRLLANSDSMRLLSRHFPEGPYPISFETFSRPRPNSHIAWVPATDLPLYAGYDLLTPRYQELLSELKT